MAAYTPQQRLSAEGLSALKRREGTRFETYDDLEFSRGDSSAGTGSRVHRGPTDKDLQTAVSDQMVTTELRKRLAHTEASVRSHVRVPLTQAQFDALVSFTYNTGPTTAGPVFRLVNENHLAEAASLMKTHYIYATRMRQGRPTRVRLPDLVRRRKEEAAPFEMIASG